MRVVNQTRGTIIAENAEAATSMFSRMRGLLGRKTLPAGGGLILEPAQSIHTFLMAFPIDVAFVAADGVVLQTIEAMGPSRISPFVRRARSIIELPAGALQQSQTQAGDRLLTE
jgi:uncharacterized membrane protein (UPF0127 family)